MLTIDSMLELLRKYDFNSTTSHPYIYASGDDLGLCYTYYDDDYGTLERIKFFDNEEILNEFLKKYRWFLNNGRVNNVRMVLDDYQIVNPKVLFLRNNKIMVKGEMFNLEDFKAQEEKVKEMDEISRTLYEAGNLILIYDEIKARQIEYFDSVKELNNQVREKYYNLQKEVDKYNGVEFDRELILQKQSIVNDGINSLMETSAKDRYNIYKVTPPEELEEAQAFVKEIWDLIMNMELNPRFYEAQATENNLRNEIRVVDKKLELLKKLNDDDDKFNKINLVKQFRMINKECEKTSVSLEKDYVNKRVDSIRRKYSYYDSIDFYYLDEYLKESIFNANYDAVVTKYAKGKAGTGANVNKPLNEIASDLYVQYRDNFTVEEQSVLVLYNSVYRKLIDIMLGIPDFNNKTFEQIKSIITKTKNHSKMKSECFDRVKKGFLANPANEDIKNKIFVNINFDTYDNFLRSMIDRVKILKSIDNKMRLTGDVKLFFLLKKVKDINSKKFIVVTNDLNSIKREITSPVDFIAVATLFEKLPILYSPYYVDFGNLYDKNVMPVYTLKEKTKFELLIDMDDVRINMDDTFSYISEYTSKAEFESDISVVYECNLANELNFCKIAFFSNLPDVPMEPKEKRTTEVVVLPAAPQLAMADIKEKASPQNLANAQPAAPVVKQENTQAVQSAQSVPNVQQASVVTPSVPPVKEASVQTVSQTVTETQKQTVEEKKQPSTPEKSAVVQNEKQNLSVNVSTNKDNKQGVINKVENSEQINNSNEDSAVSTKDEKTVPVKVEVSKENDKSDIKETK